jgi:hypothetical protein
MSAIPDPLETMLERVLATEPIEIDCDEFLRLVSPYLESMEAESELPPELLAVAQHLKVCPECAEEFEALRRAVEP